MSTPDINNIAEAALHLATATDMLQEMICNLGAPSAEIDEAEFDRVFYISLKVMQDAKALRELVEEVQGEAAPYAAKLRTAATDTALADHVLATFRLSDASPRDDTPDVRASVIKTALDAWLAKQKAAGEAM